MTYQLSDRSLERLKGVDADLVKVVKRAIELTRVDFGVTEGIRTVARQTELVNSGASKTMKSRHITGEAVDLMAYLSGRASWEFSLYDDIADAMREAAIELQVRVLWGGAWHVDDIRAWPGTMEEAMNAYIDLRRSQGKRPFVDGPHFEV